ncbi:MAG: peptidoglycan bridge formation glycyltransferase FemA/FemB family protein [Candidatus Berkelbacteria bacterium]|nr:peptidoglycan bridge formation glycyltransferase FemA/FemB family protein [Candidatus Berkelbacteria bacterium]
MNNIFQSSEWEKFKLETGYQKSFWVEDVLILEKKLPLGYSMLYSPMVSKSQVNQLTSKSVSQFSEELKKIANEDNSIFYRLEFDFQDQKLIHLFTDLPRLIPKWGKPIHFRKSFEEMQPEHTLLLDLTLPEDELLAQMKQKGRYNVRVAERNEISIEESPTEVENFYKLYAETGQRHKITYRNKRYFENLVEILKEKGYASVYTAYGMIEGKKTPLASAVIVYSGKKAIYMFGASSDEYKNLMAPYLLHWQIIKESKAAGYKYYDFFGIAPDDDPKHPWAGVTRFKKQFGGVQEDTLGSFDLIFKPLQYQVFKIAEKIRR